MEDSDDDFTLENANEENCPKVGKRKANLQISQTAKKSKKTSQLFCDLCGISFSRKDSLTRHIKNKH